MIRVGEYFILSVFMMPLISKSLAHGSGNDADMYQHIENVQKLLQHEITSIKQKLWIGIAGDIQTIQTDIEAIRREMKSLLSVSRDENNAIHETKVDQECECDFKIPQCSNVHALLRALSREKQLRRRLEHRINDLQNVIDELKLENSKTRSSQTTVLDISKSTRNDIRMLKLDVNTIREEKEHTENKLRNEIQSLQNQSSHTNEFTWLESRGDDLKRALAVKGPSFTSEWFEMRSNDDSLSEINVLHNLNVIPVKVDVEIKAVDGPNKDWLFHGDTTFQADDDSRDMYGGVVYFYDKTRVRLFAPKDNNGHAESGIVYTGSQHSRRLGDHHQLSTSALVRVRVWGPQDLPPADFTSQIISLDITNRSLAFQEIDHNLGDYPAFVTVQVTNTKTGLVSEGTGSSVMFKSSYNVGGTIWGFNDKTIRIWTSFKRDQKGGKGTYYKPIGGGDGWGNHFMNTLSTDTATVKIQAWKVTTFKQNLNFFTKTLSTDKFEFGPFDDNFKPLDNDLLSTFVEAKSGPNKGYRFKGYGNSQNQVDGFGGTVFAYNRDGEIRAWPPNPRKGGHFIYINPPYGAGNKTQISDDAVYVFNLLKSWP